MVSDISTASGIVLSDVLTRRPHPILRRSEPQSSQHGSFREAAAASAIGGVEVAMPRRVTPGRWRRPLTGAGHRRQVAACPDDPETVLLSAAINVASPFSRPDPLASSKLPFHTRSKYSRYSTPRAFDVVACRFQNQLIMFSFVFLGQASFRHGLCSGGTSLSSGGCRVIWQ